MSLHLPGRVHGRHRGLTPYELSRKASTLETTNDDLTRRLADTAARANELDAMVVTLDRDLTEVRTERDQLADEVTALRAKLANRDAVTVPPMQRDTSNGADQATAPWGLDVREVRDRFETGPVVRLGASPLADTVPVPRINQQKEVA